MVVALGGLASLEIAHVYMWHKRTTCTDDENMQSMWMDGLQVIFKNILA